MLSDSKPRRAHSGQCPVVVWFMVPPSLSGLLCCRASIIVYARLSCKYFFYIPIPVLPPLPIVLPVGGVRSLPAWLAGAATVSAALLDITAGQRQQGRT